MGWSWSVFGVIGYERLGLGGRKGQNRHSKLNIYKDWAAAADDCELEDQKSDFGRVWEAMEQECQERVYRIGSSHLHQRDLAKPREAPDDVARVRPFEELPQVSRVLEWKKGFEPLKTYPILTRDKLGELIQWCDTLPEYQDSRYQFLIDKTGPRSVAIRLTGFKSNIRRPRNIGEYALEVSRGDSGEIFEVVNGHSVSNGRFEHYLQSRNSTGSSNEDAISDEGINPYDTIERNPPSTINNSSEDLPPERVYACFAVFRKEELVPDEPTADDEKSADTIKMTDEEDERTSSPRF